MPALHLYKSKEAAYAHTVRKDTDRYILSTYSLLEEVYSDLYLDGVLHEYTATVLDISWQRHASRGSLTLLPGDGGKEPHAIHRRIQISTRD